MSKIKDIINEWLLKKNNSLELSRDSVELSKNGQWTLKKARLNIPGDWSKEFQAEQEAKAHNAKVDAETKNPVLGYQNTLKRITDQRKGPLTRENMSSAVTPSAISPKKRPGISLGDATRVDDKTFNGFRLDHMLQTLMRKASTKSSSQQADLDNLKRYIQNLKPGTLNIGQLGKWHEENHRSRGSKSKDSILTDDAFSSLVVPHLQGVENLKDVYDNHGGEHAVRALTSAHGANGAPTDYHVQSGLSDKLFSQVVQFMNPAKGQEIWRDNNPIHVGETPWSTTDPSQDHQKKVEDTYNDWTDAMSNGLGEDAETKAMNSHHQAVVDRGMDHFKRHYGLK